MTLRDETTFFEGIAIFAPAAEGPRRFNRERMNAPTFGRDGAPRSVRNMIDFRRIL
jgi:hypothetical protein